MKYNRTLRTDGIRDVQKRLRDHQELRKVMTVTGDNTETSKKAKFNDVMMAVLLQYVNTKFDFYKKLENPKIKGYVEQRLYEDLKGYVEGDII